MSSQNQLSRYGSISRNLDLAPSAKVFLVGDSDDTSYGIQNLANDFPPDRDGVTRVYSTIQAAVNAASANRGDVVLVAPGYDHSLARADTWATAGVRVIGMGEGSVRPILRYTATTDRIDVAANNVAIENLRFIADVDSVAVGVEFDTGFSGHVFRKNVFDWNSALDNFKTMLHVGSSRNLIEKNEFLTEDTIAGGSAISLDGGYPDFTTIKDNDFDGYWDTNGDTTNGGAAISVDVTHDSGDTVLVGLRIVGNRITDRDTGSSVVINLAGGATTVKGSLYGNQIIAFDTASADSDLIGWGLSKGVQNWVTHGDSDVPEVIASPTMKLVGIQDS